MIRFGSSNRPAIVVLAQAPEAEVLAQWSRLFNEGKHKGIVRMRPDVSPYRGRSAMWTLLAVPHDLVNADYNTDAEARLSPDQLARVERYRARPGVLPPGIGRFSGRSPRVYVSDGNHRAYAAKLREESHVQLWLPEAEATRFLARHSDRVS